MKRFLRVKEAAKEFGMGRNSIYKYGKEADAFAKVGGIVLIDTDRMTKYLEGFFNKEPESVAE